MDIAKLTPSDVWGTAALLAEAFSDNPSYAFMHPRAARRPQDLCAFFERNLLWHAPLDLTWVLRAHGRVQATATLEPPGGVKANARALIRHWAWPTLRDQGLHTFSRIARADGALFALNRKTAGQERYWHVHAVAVSPHSQGQGLGSALMDEVLRGLACLHERNPAPVVLSTQREINLRFYERLGFVLVDRVRVGRSLTSPGFWSWCMRLRGT